MEIYALCVAGMCGAFAQWILERVSEQVEAAKARRALPINRFAGVTFPPPDDPDWEIETVVVRIGPVTIDGCRLICHGVLVEESDRVTRYKQAVCAAQAISALHAFEAKRSRELLS